MILNFFVGGDKDLSDGFMIHSILQIAKTLHDKIDSLSSDEESARISKIICDLLRKIDFGRDLDKTLNMLTTARSYFINLDEVTEILIYQVIRLSARAHKIQNGKHSQKTLSFVKACTAFCHITIPTIWDFRVQSKLFLLTAQMALLNGLIGETDSLLKAILTTMDEGLVKLSQKLTSTGKKIEVDGSIQLERIGETL
jgi:hypothetical protein